MMVLKADFERYGPSAVEILENNVRDVELAFLEAFVPPPPLNPAKWAPDNIKFPEGTPVSGWFEHDTAPYCEEILEVLSPDHPCQEVYLPKCAQSGGTVIADIWMCSVMASMVAHCMVVHPTLGMFKEWAEGKFWPMAEASPVMNPDPEDDEEPGCLLSRHARTEGGSTAKKIKSRRGGTILGAGAESPASLRQVTIRYMVQDDIDGWTMSAGEEGDPEKLADKRLTTFRELGTSKKFVISTPLIERSSRVMKGYNRSDMRRWYMGCAKCDDVTDIFWEDIVKSETAPWNAYFICPSCGHKHTRADKRVMLRRGIWVPTSPTSDGEVPSRTLTRAEAEQWRSRPRPLETVGFWITGEMSRFLNWDRLAQAEHDAGDDPEALKVFYNTDLGRTYDVKTETPDWEVLAARSRNHTDVQRSKGARGPLVFTLSVDVQRDGLYYLVKGYNPNEEAWYLDYDFIAGETSEPHDGAWTKLTEIAERGAPLPGGARFAFDIEVVDANYHTDAAKAWVKRRGAVAMAINGAAGWGKPIIYRASESEVKRSGKKRKFGGVKIWHVGTYQAKAALVSRYRKTLAEANELGPPRGYCWFPCDAEDWFFQQLTAEYVHEEELKSTGLIRSTWKARGENHLFDCDVYSFAGLTHLGARSGARGTWSDEMWAERERFVLSAIEQAAGQLDLFESTSVPSAAPSKQPTATTSALMRMAEQNQT